MPSEMSAADAPEMLASGPDQSGQESTSKDELLVNLNIISPTSTSGPLSFTRLPSSTNVRQLKEKIRQAMPSKPSDAQQRLIYKGRSLPSEEETLLTLIGEDAIREQSHQTMHLVIRGAPAETQPPNPNLAQPASSVRGRSPAGAEWRGLNRQARTYSPHHYHPPAHQTPSMGPTPPPGVTRRVTPQQVQQMHSQIHSQMQQSMAAWNNGLQREAMSRAMANQQISQNQSARASMGLHGIGDPAAAGMADPARGRVSPSLLHQPYTRTTVREGTAGDGQQYRVTNTETWTPLSMPEVQNIIRGADAGQATQAMTNAMQRSDSGASLGPNSAATTGAGAATPYYPTMGSRAGSRRGTPDPGSRSASGGSAVASTPGLMRSVAPSSPEVYILSSPEGPRGILVNHNSDTYYTPVAAPAGFHTASPSLWPSQLPQQTANLRAHVQQLQILEQRLSQALPPNLRQPATAAAADYVPNDLRYRGPGRQDYQAPVDHHDREQPHHPQAQQPNAAQPLPLPQNQHHGAAGGAGQQLLAVGLAQLWQHLWLLVRLGLFIWWFTYPNASWYRITTIVGMALVIFFLNTGWLNPLFTRAAGPVRRHMENLIPLGVPELQQGGARAQQGPHQEHQQPQGQRQNQPPMHEHDGARMEPAQAAARMVAERHNPNAHWFLAQVRRLERAGMLFLASIAPGVAERHIARLEAEVQAEQRRRQEAEERAAAAAAEAANAEEGRNAEQREAAETNDIPDGGNATGSAANENANDTNDTNDTTDTNNENNEQPVPREGQLVDI